MEEKMEHAAEAPPGETLTQTVTRLEQEARAMKFRMLVAVFLLGTGILLLGAVLFFGGKYDYIVPRIAAKEFLVLDKRNKPVIALAAMADKPTLIFYDDRGNTRVLFSLSEEGNPSLSFLDENHAFRSVMKLNPDGNPGMELFDNTSRLRARLGILDLSNDTVSALALLGEAGEGGPAAVLVSSDKQGAILELTDRTRSTSVYR